jgi:hypothetical protein
MNSIGPCLCILTDRLYFEVLWMCGSMTMIMDTRMTASASCFEEIVNLCCYIECQTRLNISWHLDKLFMLPKMRARRHTRPVRARWAIKPQLGPQPIVRQFKTQSVEYVDCYWTLRAAWRHQNLCKGLSDMIEEGIAMCGVVPIANITQTAVAYRICRVC